jgi:hypothetical protein
MAEAREDNRLSATVGPPPICQMSCVTSSGATLQNTCTTSPAILTLPKSQHYFRLPHEEPHIRLAWRTRYRFGELFFFFFLFFLVPSDIYERAVGKVVAGLAACAR